MKKYLQSKLTRRIALAVAASGVIATVVAGRERPATPVVEPAARIDTRVRAADDLDISKLERTADAAPTADPFAPKNFNPQQQAAPLAQAKPEAPALPFRYIGKVLDGDKLSVFLARGDESFSVRPGEKIDDYRLDKVTDSEITFTYLPLKTRQSLPL